MDARFASKSAASRCFAAAACSSARIFPPLDTASVAVVSICVLPLRITG